MERFLTSLLLVGLGFLLGKYLPEPVPKVEIGGFDLKLGPVTEQKEGSE